MSDDDYHDDDSRGGLWDPDAFSPSPAPTRPTLRIVATHPTDGPPDGTLEPTNELTQIRDETLVRLEQFRPANDTARLPRPSRTLRRVAAAGAVAGVVTAAAVGYSTLISPNPSGRHAPHPVGATALADTEHTAATRDVASGHAVVHGENRSNQHGGMRHRAVSASPKRPYSPRPTWVPSTSQVPHISTSSAVRTRATVGHSAARVTSAASEFGFEG